MGEEGGVFPMLCGLGADLQAGLTFDAHPGHIGGGGGVDGGNGTDGGAQAAAGAYGRVGDGLGLEKNGGGAVQAFWLNFYLALPTQLQVLFVHVDVLLRF